MSGNTIDLVEDIVGTLREHEAELRAAGIWRLWLFGSVARGDHGADSDVDLSAEFDPDARIGLFALGGLERQLAGFLGRTVDLIAAPAEGTRLRSNVQRDQHRVF